MRTKIRVFAFLVVIFAISAVHSWAQTPKMPMPEMGPPIRDMSKEEIALEKMSMQPSRPKWAPMPLLRGKVSMVLPLHQALSSSDPGARARSAFILGQIGSPLSRESLAKLLKDPNHTVQVQAGIALACMRDARGTSICANALGKDKPWVRYYAAYGLWSINSKEAKAALSKYAKGQDKLVGPAISGALQTKYAAPKSVTAKPAPLDKNKKPDIESIWESAADIMSSEADWWWHKGNYEQSIRCHEAAILIDPDYVESYSIIAWLQWSLKRNDEAIGTLKRAIAAAPKNPAAYYEIGTHYYNTKNYPEAEKYLKQSVKLGGDHFARRMYAHSLERQNKLSQALVQWKEIVKLRPEDQAARRQVEKIQNKIKANSI
ncbi:MAG: HEAT repeat domain-containing protein [Armatimonadota bacterium]